jgi:hypothetical protein
MFMLQILSVQSRRRGNGKIEGRGLGMMALHLQL